MSPATAEVVDAVGKQITTLSQHVVEIISDSSTDWSRVRLRLDIMSPLRREPM